MRTRRVKNADIIIDNCSFLIKNPQEYRGHYQQLFHNDHPLYLEIGMGKGQFLLTSALNNPHINYLGIEKFDSIIARAIEKISVHDLPNIKVIKMDAKDIASIFDKEIDTLFLNFSDPWPKNRHAHRRLTSPEFLKLYDGIFKGDKKIILKTDNKILFASSLISLNNYGYSFKEISLDLHNTAISNIKTEYEEKFSKEGLPINYLLCEKRKDDKWGLI